MKRTSPDPPRDLEGHVLRSGEQELVLLSYTPAGHGTLTAAELRVAVGIAQGRSNREIARDLGVSIRTVANHVASVLRKLEASSRSEVSASFGIEDLA